MKIVYILHYIVINNEYQTWPPRTKSITQSRTWQFFCLSHYCTIHLIMFLFFADLLQLYFYLDSRSIGRFIWYSVWYCFLLLCCIINAKNFTCFYLVLKQNIWILESVDLCGGSALPEHHQLHVHVGLPAYYSNYNFLTNIIKSKGCNQM